MLSLLRCQSESTKERSQDPHTKNKSWQSHTKWTDAKVKVQYKKIQQTCLQNECMYECNRNPKVYNLV